MADNEMMTLQKELEDRRQGIEHKLRSGEGATLQDLLWLLYGLSEDVARLARWHTSCSARSFYRMVQARAMQVVVVLLLLALGWAAASALGAGFRLP